MKNIILAVFATVSLFAQAPIGGITQPSGGAGLPYTGTGSPSGVSCPGTGPLSSVTYAGVLYICQGGVYVANTAAPTAIAAGTISGNNGGTSAPPTGLTPAQAAGLTGQANNALYAALGSGTTDDARISNQAASITPGGVLYSSIGSQNWAACPTFSSTSYTLFLQGSVSLGSNCTFPNNITLQTSPGILINPNGYTLTFNSKINIPASGPSQLFPSTYTGTISIGTAPIYVEYFGAKSDNGTTADNSTALNNAFASALSGSEIWFGCTAGGYYLTSGQVVFKGNHIYRGSIRSTNGNCSIESLYAGTDAAFSFVGADTGALYDLRLYSGNSSTPPYTIATFGRSSGSAGSHWVTQNLEIAGYASKAAVYSIASEEWTWTDPKIILSGGGALYTYYTSQADDLSACSSCVTGSNTDVHFYGGHFIDATGVSGNHTIGLGGTGGDMSWDGGYVVGAGDYNGGTASGDCIYQPGSNSQGGYQIISMRCEGTTNFYHLNTSVNAYNLTLIGNTLSSATGTTNFVLSTGATLNGLTEENNHVPSGVVSAYGTVSFGSFINEPFAITYTSLGTGSFLISNGVIYDSSTLQLIPSSLGQSTCSSTTKGQLYDLQTGTPDILQDCQRTGAGVYSWETLGVLGLAQTWTAPQSFSAGIRSGSASNTDLSGELTFSSATTASYTFAGTYTSHSECWAEPQFDPGVGNRHWITYTSTTSMTINFATAVSGAVSYGCGGRN